MDKVVLDPEEPEEQAAEQTEVPQHLVRMDSAAEELVADTEVEDHQEVTVLLY